MQGSCLCGKVRFELASQPRSIVACHCMQCRKTSGHYVAATQIARDSLKLKGSENITWFRSSEDAMRGFCTFCGSQLFWKREDSTTVSVMAGSLDGPTGLNMDRQIHTSSKGDYYSLPDCEEVAQSSLRKS
jgi:hypothetical protein